MLGSVWRSMLRGLRERNEMTLREQFEDMSQKDKAWEHFIQTNIRISWFPDGAKNKPRSQKTLLSVLAPIPICWSPTISCWHRAMGGGRWGMSDTWGPGRWREHSWIITWAQDDRHGGGARGGSRYWSQHQGWGLILAIRERESWGIIHTERIRI